MGLNQILGRCSQKLRKKIQNEFSPLDSDNNFGVDLYKLVLTRVNELLSWNFLPLQTPSWMFVMLCISGSFVWNLLVLYILHLYTSLTWFYGCWLRFAYSENFLHFEYEFMLEEIHDFFFVQQGQTIHIYSQGCFIIFTKVSCLCLFQYLIFCSQCIYDT